jgi:uncharacterized protein with GYD domain
MAKFLLTGTFTVSGIAGVRKDGGTGRTKAIAKLAKSVGGSLESYHFAFGSDDFFIIVDLPDNTAAAAAALAVAESGAVNVRTVVLLTPEEVDAAVKLKPAYRAPGT